MKKYIFLLSMMLFAHDVMFGSKKTNVFRIADDAKRYYNIFHNFMEISELGEKKIKMSKSFEVPFKDIWKMCFDENKQKNSKNLCKAKSMLYTYIYKKIEKLKDSFKSNMVQYLNKEVGKDNYTKNKLFSDEEFKTKSFIEYVIADERLQLGSDDEFKKANTLFENIEKAHKEMCKYQDDIEELYKKSGNENEDSDDELSTEIFKMDLPYDDCKIKKEKRSSFKEKIKIEIEKIFNDETRIENFLLEIKNNAKTTAPKKTLSKKKHKKVTKAKEGSYDARVISGYAINPNYFENFNKTLETKLNKSIKHDGSIVEDISSGDILDGISGVKEIESYKKENRPTKKWIKK